jgi:hypothetical protein
VYQTSRNLNSIDDAKAEIDRYYKIQGGEIMTIEYDINCFERTLCIQLSSEYAEQKEHILKLLDKYYDEWHEDDDPCKCCEEYMMDCLLVDYEWDWWTSIDWEDLK